MMFAVAEKLGVGSSGGANWPYGKAPSGEV
jgi:hypothetical protein